MTSFSHAQRTDYAGSRKPLLTLKKFIDDHIDLHILSALSGNAHLPCAGAAWPQPFDALLCAVESAGIRPGGYEPRTLHVYSLQDRVNPPAMAARIKKVCLAP
jgi:hypothetical protein